MTNWIWGGRALIAIAIATIITFIVHPVRGGDHMVGAFDANVLTHGFALMFVPLIAFGSYAFAESLGLDRPVVRLALTFNLLAVALMAIAPLISGWVTMAGFELSEEAGHLSALLNQAMDRGYVCYSAVAMLLYGFAIDRRRIGFRILSWVAGALPLAWLASGLFAPHVHAMLILAFLQGSWFIVAGRSLTQASAE
ncbi:hypothetical protein [Sphingomonas jaspsi]|uniref:hypothetical protein n=1 Tax=Sphingomonas jaspsi TaxID=392409 RepID=UPI0004AD6CE5|nr:hypothetical protein [Sphingomonas jaspsi]